VPSVGAACAIVAVEEWHGPTMLVLSSGHGIDAGDLLAFPLVVLAIASWQGRTRRSWSRAASASAIVLGVLLLLAGVDAKAGGGDLVPAGGGTLDGTIRETGATDALLIDRWSNVALTYDGATLRLYVDGRQVADAGASGAIQVTDHPLWIGGNEPYGEYFDGLIDELRVYSRALSAHEVRADMARPVAPARGLVAGYRFDRGAGSTAADSSGEGNDGRIHGARWTRGRYGDALSFDGNAVVAVPPSASLNVTSAMTLSAWIRPTARQRGWRTVVQRQTDAYFLTAGSGRQNRLGWLDDGRAALAVAALVCLCVAIATRPGEAADRRRSWWQPVALFVAGSLMDAALAPTAALIGPALVALWLAATASRRGEILAFLLCAAAFTGLTIASIAGVAGADEALSSHDGAVARSAALGALFMLAGVAPLVARRA
jgi:Concanavalin A-like lectin/glucanases superfamily